MSVNVLFSFCPDQEASLVELAGSFNDWSRVPMGKGPGAWTISLKLAPGEHHYKFIVDNNWKHDRGKQTTNDNMGGRNNVIVVEKKQEKGKQTTKNNSSMVEKKHTQEKQTTKNNSKTEEKKNKQGNQVTSLSFKKVPFDSEGRIATVAEVDANQEKVARLLDTWTIAFIDGGKIDGKGYGGKIQEGNFEEQCGEKIIVLEVPDEEENPKEEASLGDFIGAMGSLMTAFAPKEDGEKLQEQVDQMAGLLSSFTIAPDCPSKGDAPKIPPVKKGKAVKMSPPSKAREICTLEHGGWVYQVAIANNNQTIFTGGAEGVKVWDLNHLGAAQAHIDALVENEESTHTWSMKLTPDSSSLVVGGWRNNVYIIDVGGAAPVIKSTLKTSSEACIALTFSPDGRICYTGHNDGTVAAWDINNQEVVNKMEGHSGWAKCIAVTADGTRLWSGGDSDKTMRLWDVREAKQLVKKDMEGGVKCLGCCPTEDWVVAGLDNSNLEIFSSSREDNHTLNLDSWRINSVKFASSGGWFAVSTEEGFLGGFPTATGTSMFKVEGMKDTTVDCDISQDDTHIVTGLYGNFGRLARVHALE